jgi:hypothetical protein
MQLRATVRIRRIVCDNLGWVMGYSSHDSLVDLYVRLSSVADGTSKDIV